MRKRLIGILVSISLALALTGCAGQVGSIGPQGSQGEPGQTGSKCEPGKDGTSLLTGVGAPSDALGNAGDSYIDTETWDYYLKTGAGWIKQGNIKGQDGQNGVQGSDGDDGLSAYEIYVKYHPDYEGDEEQWIHDLINGDLYEANYWTLTFETNGGTTIDPVQILDKEILAHYLPDSPKKDGFVFDGWYIDPYLSTRVNLYSMVTRNLTLYAGWRERVFTIWALTEEIPIINRVLSDYNANAESGETIEYEVWDYDSPIWHFRNNPYIDDYPSLIFDSDYYFNELCSKYDCIAPVPTDVAVEIEKTNAEKAVETAKIDDTMYAYPVSADNGYFLYYNSEFFTPKQASSMESLLATAKEKGKKVLFDLDNGYYSASVFMSPQVFGTEKGISWHYNDDNQVVYDMDWATDKGAQVAKDFSDLIVPYVEDGTLIEGDNTAIWTLSASGELQAVVSGTWVFAYLTKNWGEDKVVGTKLPTFNSTLDTGVETACQLASFIGSKLYVVNSWATEEEQATAHKVAQLLTSKEAQLLRWKELSMVPTNLDARDDSGFVETISAPYTGLLAQEPYGAIQAQVVESSYWTPGEQIGRTIMQGYYDSTKPLETLEDWKAYLTAAIKTLVDPFSALLDSCH